MSTLEDYLKNITPQQLSIYNHVRELVKQAAPDAEEKLSYGVPAFMHKGKPIIYFGAYKNHMSIYPASDIMVEAIGPDLAKMRTSKGTIQFTQEHPISDKILKQIIAFRLHDADE